MSKEDIIELDTIMELADPHARKAQGVPLSLGQDDAVFATLKAPHAKSSAAIITPYADVPSVQKLMPSHNESEAILELDNSSVVHPQYTVTTELFLDPTEQAAQKQHERISENVHIPENVHINTVRADAVHVGEVHINTLHAGKTLYDSINAQQNADTEKPTHRPDLDSPGQDLMDAQAKHEECCEDMQESAPALEESQQVLRDISTLQNALASMQLRLAAQESCVASLESRLMAAEAKNRELEVLCHKLEALGASQDIAQLEQSIASTAARIVREEIQALLDLAEQH